MRKIIIVGAGVSGLSIAQLLKNSYEIKIIEKESRPGGLIKCDRVNGHLFHRTGGHVFNTKREDVSNWFWEHFDKDKEFVKTDRYSVVSMPDGRIISYPIENHAYQFSEEMMQRFIGDLILMASSDSVSPANFEEFLCSRFGETLYHDYFQPYNEKIWRRDLKDVPLSWLVGKLPMPTLREIIYNNFNHVEEKQFVHSTFYYPKNEGSQFLANRLAMGLDICYNTNVTSLKRVDNGWMVNGELCDKVIFCGNIKDIPSILEDVDLTSYFAEIEKLEAHGTTSVLCEVDDNPYSWIYLPSRLHQAHRIICTGNFAQSNRGNRILSATIEFTDYISKESILEQLNRIPFGPKYLSCNYAPYTYPIQASGTRDLILSLKKHCEPLGLYFLGRFAEWEYYNMDVAIGASIDLIKCL
ncbi:protoporphyrinogen/coproporphyrinogen oxidase [Bacteroides cellulosilyticus]|uniref:protoporphyrinogen/coproporphyrinogen oxidase n=1 Tax=Bacteroides cellulosilyticus TaxID=246787 RepID=UPI0032C16181